MSHVRMYSIMTFGIQWRYSFVVRGIGMI